ncbi:uncharacterized protein LOC108108454 [Drosophila eugracilis]|uniref:uncharacterized protein LOC108108454 n=1 Tax=Drosophila eugracilis TaxID=29029 RepID=UPI0007E7D9E2|nr:uncharacterized protein LOC108108454 [Drosophila eugracilis]
MKSETLHKFLILCSLLIACAWSQPLNPSQQQATYQQLPADQRTIVLVKHNLRPQDAKNYQITIPKEPKEGEPCLTISWKTNPDGSGPGVPQIYMGNGYFGILPTGEQKSQ